MPFKRYLALQNTPRSKQPFKTQPKLKMKMSPDILNNYIPAARTNKRRALSLQEVELGSEFLILYIILKTCTI